LLGSLCVSFAVRHLLGVRLLVHRNLPSGGSPHQTGRRNSFTPLRRHEFREGGQPPNSCTSAIISHHRGAKPRVGLGLDAAGPDARRPTWGNTNGRVPSRGSIPFSLPPLLFP